MQSYKNLEVWKKAIDFVEDIYQVTGNFPDIEKYGLANQMRRSAVSVPANLAEGSIRRSVKEYLRFVNIARGSAAELETHIVIASRLKYIDEDKFITLDKKLIEIGKMLNGLRFALEKKL